MHHCVTTLETMGNDSFAIGDSLPRYWGFTSSLLGIHFIAIGDSLHRHWGFTSSPLGIHFIAIGDSRNFIPYKTARKFQ